MDENIKRQLKVLSDSNIILNDMLPSDDVIQINSEDIIQILEGSYDLIYDEEAEQLLYVDESGEKHIAPDLSAGMTESSEWLSDKLPNPTLDIDQGGNVRKSEEIKALYAIICIAVVIPSFKDEIKTVINSYNFDAYEFTDKSLGYGSFLAYLKTFQDLNSVRINSIISASGIRISKIAEKKDAYWRISLNAEEILEYSKVSRSIKNIITGYELDRGLSPGEVKGLSKIKRLQTIEERDIEIEKIIDASPISTIYRISKFNSERLPAVAKRNIYLSSRKIANSVVSNSNAVGFEANELYDQTFSKYTKEFTKMAVTTLRHNEIVKFKNNPADYKLIKKV
jgi:hypothetical protein